MLPIQEPAYPPITELDARKATPPPRFEVKAPEGAPNVLIVLIDDMGFGMSSAFGGPIHMPTVDRLANDGLRDNQFHTTAAHGPGGDMRRGSRSQGSGIDCEDRIRRYRRMRLFVELSCASAGSAGLSSSGTMACASALPNSTPH